MSENQGRSNVLAVTLVVAVVFQIFLSVWILRDLRALRASPGAAGAPVQAQQGLEPGTEAPPFHLSNAEGDEVTLADFEGRKVVLVFSSDQCRYCKELYPELRRLRESGEPPGVEMVMLQFGSTPEANRALAAEQGLDFPILAADRETFAAYAVPGTPFAAVVDEAGVVVATSLVSSYEQMVGLLGGGLSAAG